VRFDANIKSKPIKAKLPGGALIRKQRHLALIASEFGYGVDKMAFFDETAANMQSLGWSNASGRFSFARGGAGGAYAKTLLCLSVNDRDNSKTPNTQDFENMIQSVQRA
jgi:hypothetical protein